MPFHLVPACNCQQISNSPVDRVPVLFTHSAWLRGAIRSALQVEQWDDTDSHVEELIALTGDYRVAWAAYEEAVKRRPGRIVTLRQKTRLLADSRRKN
jgi:succinate dehydrogenase/fumarate reductase flavoprotein subunit